MFYDPVNWPEPEPEPERWEDDRLREIRFSDSEELIKGGKEVSNER
jgi:hypothetical protein